MTQGRDIINYRFLNMDNDTFYQEQSDLIDSIGSGGILRAIPNYRYNQVLYAVSKEHFTEVEAIQLCRKLSGLDRNGKLGSND